MTEPLDQNRLKILSYLHFFLWSRCCFLFFSHPFLAIIENPEIFVLFFKDILPLFSSHSSDRSYRNGLMKFIYGIGNKCGNDTRKTKGKSKVFDSFKKSDKKTY